MKRIMAVGAIAGAVVLSLQVSSAQQAAHVSFSATTDDQLRTWDQFVTARERSGELRVRQVVRDPSLPSRTIERMQQYYEGVPVWGAEVVRDSDGGAPVSMFGELSVLPTLDVRPGLSAADAEARLLGQAAAGGTLLKRAELVVLKLDSGEHRLAYTAVVSAANDAFRVFIDASSGVELLRYSSIHHQASVGTGRGLVGDTKKLSVLGSGGTFLADDQLRPPFLTTFDMRGNLGRAMNILNGSPFLTSDIAADSDNNWTDVPTIDAHAYIGWTYDYFFKRHGRRGLDNGDRPIAVLVNPVTPLAAVSLPPDLLFDYAVNAFWCDTCGQGGVGVLLFGSGIPPGFTLGGQNIGPLSGSIDIVAHELTHGVTSYSSGLIYFNESGALNEAFSDIIGTSVEFFFQPPGAGLGQADYLLGEDSFRAPGGAGLNGTRSMSNPNAFGYPDHYSVRYTGSDDNGGVHINSSIVNHAFYLAIEGGRNRVSGLTVTGVGAANREQMEKVFYRAFVFMLPATATFSTARAATIQAARDLYGVGSPAVSAVTQAWTAVGVN